MEVELTQMINSVGGMTSEQHGDRINYKSHIPDCMRCLKLGGSCGTSKEEKEEWRQS